MKKFVPGTTMNATPLLLLVGVVIELPLLYFVLSKRMKPEGREIFVAAMIITAVLLGFIAYLSNRSGLYFRGDEIYWIPLVGKRRVDPQQVIAIKLVREISAVPRLSGRGAVAFDLTDFKGNYAYTMLFLDTLDEEEPEEDGMFPESYGGHVCAQCAFDQSVIDYMQARNPKIYVIPDDADQPRRVEVVRGVRVKRKKEPERKPGPVRGWVGKTRMKE